MFFFHISDIHAESSNFDVVVTGNQNVPKYTFKRLDIEGAEYKLMFKQMFEVVGVGYAQVPQSKLSLPSLSWTFSAVTETAEELTFNITATTSQKGNKDPRFTSLNFVNHLIKDNNNTRVKFDIELKGYNWISADTEAMLVLRFQLTGKDESDNHGNVGCTQNLVWDIWWLVVIDTCGIGMVVNSMKEMVKTK